METVTTAGLQQKIGEVLGRLHNGPVAVTKNGKKRAVIVNMATFEKLEDMIDQILAEEAEARNEMLGHDESMALLARSKKS